MDAFSRFSVIYGLANKSTASVVAAILDHGSTYKMADEYGYLDIDRILVDTSPEFTSGPFKDFCMEHKINLS